jgi:hypothetical protein
MTLSDEDRAARADILAEVGGLLRDELAASEWGRLLVEVIRGPDGGPLVAGIDVEEVIGDEAHVDAIFGGDSVRPLLPVLAKAVEALCAIDDVEIDDVGGGTFVRLPGGGFGWLAALVHAPSPRLDRERDALAAALQAKNCALKDRFGFPDEGRFVVDLDEERVDFEGRARALTARATLLGTFAPAHRTWGWGGSNPHLSVAVRSASSAVVDQVLDRDAWELSTPAFATDEPTAWALCAFVCDRAKGEGVLCAPEGEGLAFFLLREVREVDAPARAPAAPAAPQRG